MIPNYNFILLLHVSWIRRYGIQEVYWALYSDSSSSSWISMPKCEPMYGFVIISILHCYQLATVGTTILEPSQQYFIRNILEHNLMVRCTPPPDVTVTEFSQAIRSQGYPLEVIIYSGTGVYR